MNTLVGYPVSPFVRKVRVALETKHIKYDLDPVVPYTERDKVLAVNPNGTVPVLVRAAEPPITESADIVDWSETSLPLPSILPPEGAECEKALAIQQFADTQFGPVFGGGMVGQRIIVPYYFGKPQGKEAIVARAMSDGAPGLLDQVANLLGRQEFVVGNFSIADAALASWIRGGQIVGFSLDEARWPTVADWLARSFAQPGFARVIESEEQTDVVRWARSRYGSAQ